MKRREFLIFASTVTVLSSAEATPESMREAVLKVTGGAQVRPGKVKLEVPPLIDNGNSSALAVAVESPMTAADHVKAIHVFAEKNPLPNVLSVYLGPRAGRAALSTRVRLADSQQILAVAQLSDGSFWSARADVIVTQGACLED